MPWSRILSGVLLALTLFLGAAATGQARGAMAAGLQITICTTAGTETIRLHDPAHMPQGAGHCPDCVLGVADLCPDTPAALPDGSIGSIRYLLAGQGAAGQPPQVARARDPPFLL
ncbi:hypothetical protein ACFSGJ_14465 [Halodurantibacterium flavum]|uniref:DUF2946 domain-containing protein n=2 Tax=Halodurantibacterium flavum TaxID=1382802 RepID=A0ABW4S9F5_9RHOB